MSRISYWNSPKALPNHTYLCNVKQIIKTIGIKQLVVENMCTLINYVILYNLPRKNSLKSCLDWKFENFINYYFSFYINCTFQKMFMERNVRP